MPEASTTMSRTLSPSSISITSTAPTTPPASPIAPVSCASMPGEPSSLTRMVRRYCALGVALTGRLLGSWRQGMLGGMRLRAHFPGTAAAGVAGARLLVECADDGARDQTRPEPAQPRAPGGERGGPRRGRAAAVPDRRPEPRLPRLLRAAGVDRDVHGRADQRDLRLRLDAREDPHRVRRLPDGGRVGRGDLGPRRAVRRLQGAAALAPGPAQAAVAGDGTAGRGVRLQQRARRGV